MKIWMSIMAQIVKRDNAGGDDFTAEAQRLRRGAQSFLRHCGNKDGRVLKTRGFLFFLSASLRNLCASAVKNAFLLAVWFSCINAQAGLIRYEDSRVSMACTYSIAAYGDDAQKLKQAVTEAFDEVDRIDRLMSHYKKDSPLSQLNREAAKQSVKVDKELFDFLLACKNYSRLSEGAFDITVGPLMKAWGFLRGEGRMPRQSELAAVKKVVGYRHLQFDLKAQAVKFDREGVELDLGGIAKGYAVDRAVAILQRHGIASALISACGSTIYGLGSPPDASGWALELQDPLDARKVVQTIKLKNQALSVAGSSEKFFALDGKRYSHIMDPRTGRPVMDMLSVAVITATGTAGDALDNIFYVQGVNWSRKNLHRFPRTEVFFFLPENDMNWKQVHLPQQLKRDSYD